MPHPQRRALARELKALLTREHEHHYAEDDLMSPPFTVERAAIATQIPWRTLQAYINGQRVPGILDVYEILKFAGNGTTFESFMAGISGEKDVTM
jgi:hypothetical protein